VRARQKLPPKTWTSQQLDVSGRNMQAKCYHLLVKALIQTLLRPFGLRLARLDGQRYGLEVLLTVLKNAGFSPEHVIDVGANHGNWTRASLKFFPDAQYTLLEPQDHLKVHHQDLIMAGSKIKWINAGASDTSGTLPFKIARWDHSSAFVAAEPDCSNTSGVEVISLDDLIIRYKLPIPQLVKIDAEGFDLKVLLGAKTLLGNTDVFLVEVSVFCPYENNVAAVMQFMTERGYRLIDITDMNRSRKYNVLWLMELAFLREKSALLSSATSYD
jgi:FkbM family methyltransferase